MKTCLYYRPSWFSSVYFANLMKENNMLPQADVFYAKPVVSKQNENPVLK